MFAKVFSQIFDSSIAENYTTRHLFMDMLVLADSHGVVDMTLDAIARRTNVPLEVVQKAVTELMEPDPKSRCPDENGQRIVLVDSHRDWGWQIVNYEHYRQLRDEEARKDYFRDYKREYRAARKLSKTAVGQNGTALDKVNDVKDVHTLSTLVHTGPHVSTHAEEEGEEEVQSTPAIGGGLGGPPQKARSAPSVGPEFEQFWAALHRDNRKYKGRAREAWKKAIKNGATAEQILSGVDSFNRSEKKRRRQDDYRATHPATWLNGGGFEDDEVVEQEEENDGINESIYG